MEFLLKEVKQLHITKLKEPLTTLGKCLIFDIISPTWRLGIAEKQKKINDPFPPSFQSVPFSGSHNNIGDVYILAGIATVSLWVCTFVG